MWWQQPVTFLKGIGPKKAEELANVGIFTVGDLLEYYPRQEAYIDYGNLKRINELKMDGSRQVFKASVHSVRMAKAKALVERRKDEGDFLKLDIRLEIGQERGIAAISDDVRTQVGRYVTQAAGIDNVELAVSVQGIASGVAVKKRRIR